LAFLSLLIVAALAPSRAPAQAVFSTEYDIKAALLFHLTQFTEWPASAFTNSESPIVIGVLGDNPFGTTVDKTVGGEKVQNRRVETRYFNSVDQVKCHVLFVSRSETAQIDRIIAKLRARGILTVSDIDRFARRGGMVAFRTDRNRRVNLNINLAEVEAARLKISSKLLRIANLVETSE
jgi:hypothetical protein